MDECIDTGKDKRKAFPLMSIVTKACRGIGLTSILERVEWKMSYSGVITPKKKLPVLTR